MGIIIPMMNMKKFREDYLAARSRTGMKQMQIEAAYKVSQTAISRLECGTGGLGFESVVKLWPFVYSEEFPVPNVDGGHE